MSHVVSTFKSAVRTAVDVPSHAILLIGVSFVALIASLVLAIIPLVGPLVSSFFLTPLVVAGVVGSANAARQGRSPVDGLKNAITESGASIIGAFGLLYIGMTALWMVVAVVLAIGMFLFGFGATVATPPTDPGMGAGMSVFGIVAALVFLVVFVVTLALTVVFQFIAPSAVLAGTGAVESLKSSYRLCRQNIVSVLGFSAVSLGVLCAGYGVIVALVVVGRTAGDVLVGFGLGAIGYLLVFPLIGSVLTLHQVFYFDAVADESVLPEQAGADDGSVGSDDVGGDGAAETGSFTADAESTEFDFGDHEKEDESRDESR